MSWVALPESGLTPAVIHPDNGDASTGEIARMYERNKRLNGTSPMPALLVNADQTATPVPRQPIAITGDVPASTPGTEDFSAFVLAPRASGNYEGVPSINTGWFFGGNWFCHTGSDSGDAAGLDEFIALLVECSIMSDAAFNDVIGIWAEASFLGAGSDDATAASMRSLVVIAPQRKDGNTGGTISGAAYGGWYGGVNNGHLGAPEGYSIYVADGGDIRVSGHSVLGGGITLADVAPIFWGDLELTQSGGALVSDGGFSTPSTVVAALGYGLGDYDHRIDRRNGTPEGHVFAKPGSFCLDDTGKVWVKASGDFETGWAQLATV